ncbi:small multi-drug export protein [Methanobrevibacter sp. TMH8]|uniref:small multi-drug export protein n=1 Tax=Methanobrevibacter sp. TMH8 TaxID=2848611 RepID=UPI001CD03056|nr:small multi-drug export protein [Methanobrevibacter sp. TMH8]MBZ9570048.1 small multi-drug export protein [Methanobrevibacter sp. TMH8]
MDILIEILVIFIAAILELWFSIPLGLGFGLNPILIIVASSLGSILSAIIIAYFGESIRNWIIKRKSKNKDIKEGRAYDIWNKYGTVGLGLLSPLLFGAPIGTAIGIALGIPKKNLIKWMSIGIVVWSIILTTAGDFGIDIFQKAMS